MHWLLPSLVAAFSGTILLVLIYLYLFWSERRDFLVVWALGWTFYAARFAFMLPISMGYHQTHPVVGDVLLLSNQWSAVVSAIFMLWGTLLFVRRRWHWLLAVPFVVAAGWVTVTVLRGDSLRIISMPSFFIQTVVFAYTGYCLLSVKEANPISRRVVGWAVILWGIHKANYPFLVGLRGSRRGATCWGPRSSFWWRLGCWSCTSSAHDRRFVTVKSATGRWSSMVMTC